MCESLQIDAKILMAFGVPMYEVLDLGGNAETGRTWIYLETSHKLDN